jgi:hypothetical protein
MLSAGKFMIKGSGTPVNLSHGMLRERMYPAT